MSNRNDRADGSGERRSSHAASESPRLTPPLLHDGAYNLSSDTTTHAPLYHQVPPPTVHAPANSASSSTSALPASRPSLQNLSSHVPNLPSSAAPGLRTTLSPILMQTTAPAHPHPLGLPTPSTSPTHFDTASGVAMVSLEAAAEPHYVGESSGAFWSTVVGKGITANMTDMPKHERDSRSRPRSPTPSDQSVLLSALQRGVPDNVADRVLKAVYGHLHPRVGQLCSLARWAGRCDAAPLPNSQATEEAGLYALRGRSARDIRGPGNGC